MRPEVIVDIEEAKEIIADPAGAALVSVRTWREHIGNVSGYNYIGPAGRIKGDVWGNCGTDAYHMQHYRQVGRLLLRHRLAGKRDLVLRVPSGMGAHRGLRRRLVRVEPGPDQQSDRGRRAGDGRGGDRRLTLPAPAAAMRL